LFIFVTRQKRTKKRAPKIKLILQTQFKYELKRHESASMPQHGLLDRFAPCLTLFI